MSRDRTVAGVGTAVLTGDNDEDDAFTIHGIAIGSGDVTVGSSGIKKIWPEDELEKAAETLEGKPLVKDHENSVDGVVGRVTRTKFKPGTGVLYEATISSQFEELAQKIADGLLEVSVRAYHAPTEELEEDEDTGALVVEDIAFDNLAVVPQGAAPSNTANAGAGLSNEHPTLSAAELRAEFGVEEEEELGLHVLRLFGFLPNDREFVDDVSVDDVLDDLSGHDAVTAVIGEEDSSLVLVVDSSQVESNDSLDEHVMDVLDDTPWEVHEGWNWLDRVEEKFSSGTEPDTIVDELEKHTHSFGPGDVVEWGEDGVGVVVERIIEDEMAAYRVERLEAEDDGWTRTDDVVTVTDAEATSSDVDVAESARHDDDDMAQEYTPLSEWTSEELQEISVHEPEWSGTTTGDWSKPALEDFDTDDLSEIDDHFIVSKDGFPPENYGDLSLPVVHPNGNLNLSALQNAKARAGQVSGLGGDTLDRVESMINRLANEHFDADFGDEEASSSPADSGTAATNDYTIASIVDDSSKADKLGTSDRDSNDTHTTMEIDYKTVDGDELDEGFVAVDREQLDAVVEKAERAETLDSRLDEMNDTLSTLSDKTEILDEVDEEDLQALRDHEDPIVKERAQYEADQEAVNEVGSVFAELLSEQDSIFTAEELQERHSPLELKAKYEEQLDDDESLVDQLAAGDPEPEGESVDPEELEEPDPDEAELTKDAAREYLASAFEEKGYHRQAEEMRSGEIPVEEYEEKLGVSFE